MNNTYSLIKAAQNGDKLAMQTLVDDNSRLVYSIAARFRGRGCEDDDLFQLGFIGLIKAIYRFDTSLNTTLSTYAVPLIMGEIRKFLRDDGLVKVSRSLKQCAACVASARRELLDTLGREPELSELCEHTGYSVEQISESSDAMRPVLSIYESSDEDSPSIADSLCSSDCTEDRLDKILVGQIISLADKKEKQVIIYRFFKGLTQSETARIMGISQVSVSRCEKKLFSRLKSELLK